MINYGSFRNTIIYISSHTIEGGGSESSQLEPTCLQVAGPCVVVASDTGPLVVGAAVVEAVVGPAVVEAVVGPAVVEDIEACTVCTQKQLKNVENVLGATKLAPHIVGAATFSLRNVAM